MARLQDAASQPVVSRDGRGDQEQPSKDGDTTGVPSGDEGGRNGNGAGPEVPTRVSDGAAAAAAVAGDEWVEETVEHPAPDYGVDSPVIR